MQTFNEVLNINIGYDFNSYCKLSEIVFFDIETTGFAADISSIYLIGCCYYNNSHWKLIQWFADDYTSEISIIKNFFEFISNYKILIHYNGNGFDIPYISKKCTINRLHYNFDSIQSIDIYKKILPYKKMFYLPDLKQKSLEQFFNVARADTYHGGELIEVYVEFMKCKYTNKQEQKSENLSKLLLHNADDLKGLMKISSILHFTDFFEKKLPIKKVTLEDTCLKFEFDLPVLLPFSFSYEKGDISFRGDNREIILKVSIFQGELKFFFSNYKDYYYLPAEDIAIHKSIASYVDKSFRSKAKASNCYNKKSGLFVPQYNNTFSPFFKMNHNDKITYILVSDDFLNNNEALELYVQDLKNHALK